jgi:hypothetical protein
MLADAKKFPEKPRHSVSEIISQWEKGGKLPGKTTRRELNI